MEHKTNEARSVDMSTWISRYMGERFLVTGLGRQKIILGFPWLTKMNPIIDWQKGTLEWRQPNLGKTLLEKEKQLRTTATIAEEEDEEEHLNSTQNPLDDNELLVLISTITGDIMSSFSLEKNSFFINLGYSHFFHSFIHSFIHCFYRGNIFPKKVKFRKLID